MDLILKNALVVGGVLLFFALLRTGANRPARRDPTTGELVLQFGKGLTWSMGAIAVGGPLLMAVLSFIMPFENTAQVFVPLVLGAFFLLLGGLLCLWALRRRTRIGERGLMSEYVFAKPRFLPWTDVVKVSFAGGQEFWVQGAGRQKAMLHVWFAGVKEAVPLLRQYLPDAVRQKDESSLANFAAMTGAS
jgi:hypothetical protein